MPIRILVVDSETAITKLLQLRLDGAGYKTTVASTGIAALIALKDEPNLIILDTDLPDMPGLDVLQTVRGRGSDVPIIILSRSSDEILKVAALELGASDYLTKPFGIAELLARMRRKLRFVEKYLRQEAFNLANIKINLGSRTVVVEGRNIYLTRKEFELLAILVRNANKVLTHSHIINRIWGAHTKPHYLRTYIKQLRFKIEAHPEYPRYIVTIPSVGYILRDGEK